MAVKKEVTLAPATEQQPSLPQETVKEVQQTVAETVTLQPMVQPIVYQTQEEVPIAWQEQTPVPFPEETTPAEDFALEAYVRPLSEKAVAVFWYNLPTRSNFQRPREYVVVTPDESISDIDFADNKHNKEESRATVVIQGRGNTMDNRVLEISRFIVDRLRPYREIGKVRDIRHDDFGFDVNANIYTRTVTYIYVN